MAVTNEHVADLVDDYLHALLSPGRAAEVENHCTVCPTCQAALDEARRRRAVLQAVPPSEASGQLLTGTLRRISEHDQKRRRRRTRFFVGSLAALAASALLLIGAQIYYHRLQATPYDLVVLGQRNLLAATNSSLRIRLMDRARNTTLAGVPVVVELRGNGRSAELARFDTDAQGVGQPRFRLPDWPDGEYGLVVTAQTPGNAEILARSIRLTRSWKLMLTSDKPVYQPGQTIRIRTLALRQPDLRPVAEQKAVFTLTDPKGNILFKHAGPTSAYGIVSTDCPLAKEIAEGAYTLACKIGDTESRLRVEVQKYVLPKFQVDVRPNRAFYQPKDTARITVQADYFFGKPVADAPVEMEVRQDRAQVLQRFSVRTDAKGSQTIDYTIPDELAKVGDTRLSFVASVTDNAGQKQTRGVERAVTRQPVRIEVLPENGKLVQGVPNIVYLLATRADGTPVKTRLEIDVLNEVVETDANGLASCEMTPQAAEYRWTIVARDAEGKVIAQRDVSLFAGPARHDFLLRTDRGIYESGQTMTLTADGDGDEPVFVDFLKGEQTLLSETIAMNDGHGSSAFDLPPDLFGTVRVCAYRLDSDGVLLSKTRVVYIRPAGQLKIAPKLDQEQYRPGRRAHLDLTLTDADGKPTPGAISLAGVDEAVFSVLPQRPGVETAFYTLERQLLQPVYALYPWSPERKAADAGRLEQALFAATTRGQEQKRPGRNQDWRTDTNAFANPSGSHTLAESSLPAKVRDIQHTQQNGENRLRIAWGVLILATLGLGYVTLWCFPRLKVVLILHAAAFLVVTPLLLLFIVLEVGIGAGAKESASMNTAASPVPGGTFRSDFDLTNTDLRMDEQVQLNFNVDRIEDVSVPGAVDPSAVMGIPSAAAPRIRKAFPETLMWTPQLVTDDKGHAHLDIELADSITTWRVSASVVAADGRLGATQLPLKVFQPFFVDLNLPVSLTRNDEVSVPSSSTTTSTSRRPSPSN
ncbi:MAG TPA: MG2 domain-containing protein [Gemmataceae bacterium]|nr:MG2 domain-containing protein [Gemmataceae bacterium]